MNNSPQKEILDSVDIIAKGYYDKTAQLYDGLVISAISSNIYEIKVNGQIYKLLRYGTTAPDINSIVKVFVPRNNWTQAYFIVEPGNSSQPAGTTNYNDLTNQPQINTVTLSGNKTSADLGLYGTNNVPPYPVTSVNGATGAVTITVPTKTSELTNDSNFITASQSPVQSVDGLTGTVVLNDVKYTSQTLTTAQQTQVRTNIGAGTSSFSGSYTDLTNKPTIPSKTSELTNDSGFITSAQAPVQSVNSKTGAVSLVTDDIPATTTNRYVPAVPTSNPDISYLNGNGVFSTLAVGGASSVANVFFSNTASTVSGYKTLNYVADATATELSVTMTSAADVLSATFLYSAPLGVTVIDAGVWDSTFYMKCSTASTGVNRLKMVAFVRHTDGTETDLFTKYSSSVNLTVYDSYYTQTNHPSFTVLATDILGVRIYGNTTRNASTTITYTIGGTNASFFNTPLALRHSQLRDLNGDSNYQHITSTQVTQIGTNTTNISGLTTTVNNHIANTSNPHAVTKAQVGLSNVANVLQYSADNPQVNITGNAGTATKALQDGNGNIITSTYLPLTGGTITGQLGANSVFRNGRIFNNVLTFELGGTSQEIVIYTKIPYISRNAMPLIHIKGYAYDVQSPIELTLGFYIYNNTLGGCGCTSTCPWKPTIYLSSYTSDSTKYVALSLKTSIYYPRFVIDFTDIWSGTSRDYSSGWTSAYNTSTTTTIIPQDDIITVPYKSIANDILGNATTATTLQTARTIALSGGATGTATSFNGSANISIPVTSLDATKLTGTASISTTGNAATATKATQDGSGNNIVDTYATKTSIPTKTSDITNDSGYITSVQAPVQSVNGYTGTVALTKSDVGLGNVANVLQYSADNPQVNITGNAGTATKFAAAQSIALTGDVTGSASSQAGWSIATLLANSGVTAGSYGLSAAATPAFGGTVNIPYFTIDAKGRVTLATSNTLSIPSTLASTTVNGLMSSSDKTKLNGIESGAQVNTVTSVNTKTGAVVLSASDVGALPSTTTYVSSVNGNSGAVTITVPTKTSDLTNDSGFLPTTITSPANGQIIAYNGTAWINQSPQSFSQQQSNWAETSTASVQYIQNKPTTLSAFTNDTNYITASGAPVQSVNGQTGTVTITTISGNAGTASALTTNAGSATNPVYFSGGVPVAGTYTLANACTKSYTDSSSASALTSTGTSLSTERDIYYGLPTINGSHAYTSSTNIYPPTSVGTSGYLLQSSGGNTPSWVAQSTITAGKATADASGNTITTTYAKLASPALTGTPTAPTAASGTNTTQIATTAFVTTAVSGISSGNVTYLSSSQPTSANSGDMWYQIL